MGWRRGQDRDMTLYHYASTHGTLDAGKVMSISVFGSNTVFKCSLEKTDMLGGRARTVKQIQSLIRYVFPTQTMDLVRNTQRSFLIALS